MVDIAKSQQHTPGSFYSHFQSLRNKYPSQQVTLPIFINFVNNIPLNERLSNNNYCRNYLKRCADYKNINAPRLLDVSNAPYELHRKVMYQELHRQNLTKRNLNNETVLKNKQREEINSMHKDTTKNINVNAQVTAQGEETNITSQASFNYGDAQSKCLFNALSKHVTVKPEPIRAQNAFSSNTTSTLSSWQQYWASTHAQRRRIEVQEGSPFRTYPRRVETKVDQIQFVVARDSPIPNAEVKPLIGTNTARSNLPKVEKQITSKTESEVTKESNYVSSIEFVASELIPSSTQINSSKRPKQKFYTNTSAALKMLNRKEKNVHEKSVLQSSSSESASSSALFKSESQLIDEVADAQKSTITTKFINLSLTSAEEKTKNSSPSARRRRRTRSKSLEKKPVKLASPTKRKQNLAANQNSSNKFDQSNLSSILTTTSRSKYDKTKWTEPYVKDRSNPPAPPCSPSLNILPQNNSDDDDDLSLEKSEFFETSINIKDLNRNKF